MRVQIIKWKPMSWYWLIKEELEGKELEVEKEEDSALYKGRKAYLIKGYNKYVPVNSCEIVSK